MPILGSWNEEFIVDVHPDTIYHSKVVVELCERSCLGEHILVGIVDPPIGLEDLGLVPVAFCDIALHPLRFVPCLQTHRC